MICVCISTFFVKIKIFHYIHKRAKFGIKEKMVTGPNFSIKVLRKVDWSSLFWNFSGNCPGTISEVSVNAACIDFEWRVFSEIENC